LGKTFRQAAGVSLHDYVLARRMRLAETLPVKSDLPLAAIAEAAGFSNQSHFTSVFSIRVGIPPSAYRQMKRLLFIARF
jgi:AraC family transcriptional regulator